MSHWLISAGNKFYERPSRLAGTSAGLGLEQVIANMQDDSKKDKTDSGIQDG